MPLDRHRVGLVVSVMIRTRHHSTKWLATFRKHVLAIPDVTDFFRIGGDYDHLLKIVTHDMICYDAVYQKRIAALGLVVATTR